MIKYCGRAVAFIQYMPAKLIKYGIKVFCLCCAATVVMLAFGVYTTVDICKKLIHEADLVNNQTGEMIHDMDIPFTQTTTILLWRCKTFIQEISMDSCWYCGSHQEDYLFRQRLTIRENVQRCKEQFKKGGGGGGVARQIWRRICVGQRMPTTCNSRCGKIKNQVGFNQGLTVQWHKKGGKCETI